MLPYTQIMFTYDLVPSTDQGGYYQKTQFLQQKVSITVELIVQKEKMVKIENTEH